MITTLFIFIWIQYMAMGLCGYSIGKMYTRARAHEMKIDILEKRIIIVENKLRKEANAAPTHTAT